MTRLAPLLLLLAACTATPRHEMRSAAQSALPLAELPPQTLPQGTCALFLWERSASGRRVLMATGNPPRVRVVLGGRTLDLPLVTGDAPPVLGVLPRATYASGGVRVAVDVSLEARPGLLGGALVRDGTLTLTGIDGSEIVAPVGGLLGCR